MELRVLLVVGDQSAAEPSGLNAAVADAVTEIAQRRGIDVTVTMRPDDVCARTVDLARYHLVHVIGAPTPAMLELGRISVPLVVTPNRRLRRAVPVRRKVAAARPWWLVHGRINAAALVTDGVASSNHVLPLPVLPYLDSHRSSWGTQRARARQELGVSPGQAVVVGFGPTTDRLSAAVRQLGRVHRHDRREIVPVWVASGPERPGALPQQGLPRETHVVGAEVGRRLLPAMDVLVCSGSSFAARSPAVDAAAAGIPIISTAADVAADFVDLAGCGSLVLPGDGAQLAQVVHDALQEAGLGRPRRFVPPDAEDAVDITERCYSRALGRPLSSHTTLLRGARS
jgi:hypothetical protein